jgi:putative alpha-1,2-mannosidase
MEDEQESVSRTLEYAYNDYCIAVMGMILNKQNDYEKHLKRSQFYKNLFDKQTGFMRPKQNGNWISPFQPNEVTFHFTEGNSWQYSFFVPHDVSGLMSLHGGKKEFVKKLDALFTTDSNLIGRDQPDIMGLIGQYAHGNEPSHHIAYLYNYADELWKTQKLVRRIMDEFYKPTPDGLIGNEDCGQMSAWYILSAMGFYQVNPSVPVYTFGTPLFREAKIHLENGKTFTIKAANVSAENIYIKSVKLNGKDYRKSFFTHQDLQNGGTLEFEMSAMPVKNWFTESPVSKVEIDFPPVSTIEGKRVFEGETDVVISTPEKDVKVYYTMDATVWTENGKLVLRLKPAPNFVADLEHWHYDTFKIKWRPSVAYNFPQGFVTFTIDKSGKPDELKIDQPNNDFWFYELEFRRKNEKK